MEVNDLWGTLERFSTDRISWRKLIAQITSRPRRSSRLATRGLYMKANYQDFRPAYQEGRPLDPISAGRCGSKPAGS